MHGRICAGLLAGFFFLGPFLGSPILTQPVQGQDASRTSDPPTEPSNAHQRNIEQSNAQTPVVTDPTLPITLPALPITPGMPAPIPQPLPWPGPRRGPVSPAPSGFAQLARSAGIIFSGIVIKVEHTSANIPGQAAGTVAITFQVETAIRGVAGKSLTITQWIGLWSRGQRYRVGERLLLFLYPRSRVGLTSCVAAGMGRFAVDSSGSVWLSPQQILVFRTDPVLGRKSRLTLRDFASAVRRAGEEE
jgi:hypothetical protein